MKYYIWNFERGQWWMPNRHGYTDDIEQAGTYSLVDAIEICQRANIHLQKNHTPEEAMVPTFK